MGTARPARRKFDCNAIFCVVVGGESKCRNLFVGAWALGNLRGRENVENGEGNIESRNYCIVTECRHLFSCRYCNLLQSHGLFSLIFRYFLSRNRSQVFSLLLQSVSSLLLISLSSLIHMFIISLCN